MPYVIAGVIALVVGIYAFITWLFTLCWNFVVAGVFGAPELTFWHSLAIVGILWIIAMIFRNNNSSSK